jgi:hypothetical protein
MVPENVFIDEVLERNIVINFYTSNASRYGDTSAQLNTDALAFLLDLSGTCEARSEFRRWFFSADMPPR